MDARLLPERLLTSRLVLQKLRYEDAEEIFYTYASKPDATKYVSWKTHERIEDTVTFLRYAHAAWVRGDDYSYSIRLQDSGRMAGSIGVLNRDGEIQFGYVVSPSLWNRGIATEAASKVLEMLVANPVVRKISTFADVDNTASVQVLRKIGLTEEGKREKWFRFPNQNNELKDCMLFSYPLPGPE